MSYVTRLGDKCSGHDACQPTSLKSASTNVIVNGLGIGRKTDIYDTHGCDVHSPHNDVIVGGSSTVFANGLPVSRINDNVSIGGVVATGSNNVKVGD